jgi:hypothetical protein
MVTADRIVVNAAAIAVGRAAHEVPAAGAAELAATEPVAGTIAAKAKATAREPARRIVSTAYSLLNDEKTNRHDRWSL